MPVSSVRNDVYLKKLYIIIYTTCDPKQKSWICIKYLEKKTLLPNAGLMVISDDSK